MKRRTIQPRMRRRRKARLHERNTLRLGWDLHLFSVWVGRALLEYSRQLKVLNDAIAEAIQAAGDWRGTFVDSVEEYMEEVHDVESTGGSGDMHALAVRADGRRMGAVHRRKEQAAMNNADEFGGPMKQLRDAILAEFQRTWLFRAMLRLLLWIGRRMER